MQSIHPRVLTMVIVPLPAVRSLVKPATALPDGAGRLPAATRGGHANSPTGCWTGRAGGVRIHSLMSASVTLPSAPPGFTTVNGRATAPAPVPAAEDGALLLFLPQLPSPSSFSACRDENFARRAVKKLLLVTAVKCDCVRQGRHGRTFPCRALRRAVGAGRLALGDTGVSGPWVDVAVR